MQNIKIRKVQNVAHYTKIYDNEVDFRTREKIYEESIDCIKEFQRNLSSPIELSFFLSLLHTYKNEQTKIESILNLFDIKHGIEDSLPSTDKDEQLLKEIMASALGVIITKLKEQENYWDVTTTGEDLQKAIDDDLKHHGKVEDVCDSFETRSFKYLNGTLKGLMITLLLGAVMGHFVPKILMWLCDKTLNKIAF